MNKHTPVSASFPKGAQCNRSEQEVRDARSLSMLAVIQRGASNTQPVIHRSCFFCGADAPIGSWVKNGRHTVECEADGCEQQTSVSANSSKAAWIMWDALGVEI